MRRNNRGDDSKNNPPFLQFQSQIQPGFFQGLNKSTTNHDGPNNRPAEAIVEPIFWRDGSKCAKEHRIGTTAGARAVPTRSSSICGERFIITFQPALAFAGAAAWDRPRSRYNVTLHPRSKPRPARICPRQFWAVGTRPARAPCFQPVPENKTGVVRNCDVLAAATPVIGLIPGCVSGGLRFCELCEDVNNFSGKCLPAMEICAKTC